MRHLTIELSAVALASTLGVSTASAQSNLALVDGAAPRSYTSPSQSEQQARSLIGVLLGAAELQGTGPWTQPVAGGRRVIELDEVQQ